MLKRLGWGKPFALSLKSIKNLKCLKYHTFVIKHCFFLIFVTNKDGDEKIFKKKKNQLRCSKFLV